MHSKVCDKITYPTLNVNRCTVDVLEWISNFAPHIKIHAGIKVKLCYQKGPFVYSESVT